MKKFFTSVSLFSLLAGIGIGVLATSARAGLPGSSIFPDVRSGSYYDEAIGALYGHGILTGYADGRFGPDDPLTRGQIAVIMQRFMEMMGVSSSSSSTRRASSTSSSAASEDQTNSYGVFRFAVSAFNVSEASSRASLTIVRTTGNTGTARVDYETANGTATAGTDYTAATSTVTFADGESTKTISIVLNNDTETEDAETFSVVLKNPTGGATLSSGSATVTVTILDNDATGGASASSAASVGAQGALTLGANAYAVDENAGTLTVTVERAGGTTGEVSVQYATSNNTAESSTHYNATSGTLTFGAGEGTRTFAVDILNNEERKGNKIFNLSLSNPTGGAVLGAIANAQVSIVDDETITSGTGSLKFEDATMDTTEGEVLHVSVLRVGGTLGDASVNYATSNTGAQAGFDYQSTSGTLTFRAGESKKLILVPILADNNLNEGIESFKITLSVPTNGVVLTTPNVATINITE